MTDDSKDEGATVQDGSVVLIDYTLALEDGTIVESTDDGEPLRFTIGDGTLIEGLERVLFGMRKGERQFLQIDCRDAFGYPSEENIHDMARSEFQPDIKLEPGLIIGFATPSGEEIPGTVLEVHAASVRVDFNHPLAGHNLLFDVTVVDIDPGS